ncbi:DUF6976 family protein [Salinivirga cyanobacteriivorans]
MSNQLYKPEEVIQMIEQGKVLMLAGDESQLDQLPDGKWVGGTIPYFMTKDGGMFTKDFIYVNDITDQISDFEIKHYDANNIDNIVEQSYENGFSFLILPGLTDVWSRYALESPEWEDIYVNPVVGWVSGVKYEDFGKIKPKTYAGNQSFTDQAVVMHAKLPDEKVARVEIINVYEQGSGDEIYFDQKGFGNNECVIDGKHYDLYKYLKTNNIDETLPLVANYAGANINVGSIWDKDRQRADLFAPVFPETPYKVAKSRDFDYAREFKCHIAKEPSREHIVFSCNCLFNYVNFGLEGKNIADVSGPVTFGEIAYHVLNLTFVYMVIE